jgi:hypothetical protein
MSHRSEACAPEYARVFGTYVREAQLHDSQQLVHALLSSKGTQPVGAAGEQLVQQSHCVDVDVIEPKGCDSTTVSQS